MKKIVSIILAVMLIAGVAVFSVSADTETDLCRKFDSELGCIYYKEKDFSEMSASSIAYYTAGQDVANEND